MTKTSSRIFFGLAGVLVFGLAAPDAFAHAKLLSSVPAKDAEGATPAEIVLTFNEAVTPAVVTLADQAGHEIKTVGAPRAEDATLHVPVTGKLAPGHYTLSYRIAGADTHVVNGTLTFVVAGGAPKGVAGASK